MSTHGFPGMRARLAHVWVLSMIFILAVAPCGIAEANVLFFDDFESYAAGTFPSAGGWIMIHNGAGTAEQYVDTTHAFSGTKSLRTMGSSCWASTISKALTIPNQVRLEAKVYVDQVAAGGCSGYRAQVGLWRDDDSMWAGAIVFFDDGNIYAINQTPGTSQVLLMPYSVGQWYDVRVDYDYAAKIFDVYINGTLAGQAIPILDNLTNRMPNAVRVGAVHGPYPLAWYDDVRVTDMTTCATPPSDMVAWWSGDGHPFDIVGGNDGTLGGGATYADGKVGKAFSFDGVDDYVRIEDSPSLRPAQYTVDAWVYPQDSNGGIILEKRGPGGHGLESFALWSYGYLFGGNYAGRSWIGGNVYDLDSGVYPAVNTWAHLAMTYDGTTLALYVNGVLKASTPASGAVQYESHPLTIGSYGFNPDSANTFKGLIDEVEIFDRALSQAEIQAIYNAGAAGKCKPCIAPPTDMVAWWTFDEGVGTTAADSIGSNDGTIYGAAWATGKVDGALSFNGLGDYVDVGAVTLANQSFTWDAWVKRMSSGSPEIILGHGTSDFRTGLHIGFRADSSFVFGFYSDDLNVAGPYSDLEWHHWAGTFDASTRERKLYRDGQLVGSNVAGGAYQGSGSLWIGRSPWENWEWVNGGPFKGLIDEVEIFNRALSAEEIAAIYAAGSAGKCLPGAVNGQCGSADGGTFTSAPTSDLCAAGTPSTVTGSGPWAWTCYGANGGTNEDCNANIQQYTVTTTAVNGTIESTVNPLVNHGSTTTVQGSANANYYFSSVSGCGGTPQNNTNQSVTSFSYTTGAITAPCTVTATFAIKTYTVTPSAGPNGTIAPNTQQVVNHGETTQFTVTPAAGYTASVGGTCGGTLVGTTYTTNAITANCTVDATFTAIAQNGPDLTGTWQSLTEQTLLSFRRVGQYVIRGSLKVTNIGNKSAGSFRVSYYLSNDGVTLGTLLSQATVCGRSRLSRTCMFNPGQSTNLAFSYPSLTSLKGKYIIAVIDSGNAVAETNETNNRAAGLIQ